MSRRRIRLIVIAIAAIGFSGERAMLQSPAQRPLRDLRTEATGTGVIAGVVTEDGESKRPLRRAAVVLDSSVLMASRQFFTRDDGSFVFDGLPPGQYSLVASASRSGYMTAEYGARRQGGTGSAIALGNGQQFNNIVLRLSRFAAITGVIYDKDGEPAPNISVEAMRYTMRTGRRTLSSVYGQPATTDDRGVYRLAGLLPGDYYVAAGPSPDGAPLDVQVLTAADVDRALQRLNPQSGASPELTFDRPRQMYAPVYFPGSTDFSGAQVIRLGQSEERSGVDVHLQLVPTARVEGTVLATDTRPVSGLRVSAVPVSETSSLDLFSPGIVTPVSTDSQGRFVFRAMPPGRYTLSVKAAGDGAGAATHWAATVVTVTGDQTVSLTLQPGATISGKVMFAGSTAPPRMAEVRLLVRNLDGRSDSFFNDPIGLSAVAAKGDGTFTFTGLPPGHYMLFGSAPAAWSLRSAIVNGVDSLDVPFSIAPAQTIDGASIVFTDKPTSLAGTLQTATGDPTSDYFIIAFAADRSFWTQSSRRGAMSRPSSAGRYEIKGLPPGEYLVVAMTDVEYGDWWDPALLERLAPAASKITLSEGESKTLDLKIGGS